MKSLLRSFYYALEGILYALKTQRNMKIHFVVAIGVLVLSSFLNISKLEYLMIFAAISLVIITEMINTSIEAGIDLVTKEYHELAKTAKNVAAGAVLIASINAIIVGYIVFFEKLILKLRMF